MAIIGQNSLLNQYVPTFYIKDLVNGQTLSYNSTKKAFVNTDTVITLSGDVLGSGYTNIITSLADVNANVGTFGTPTSVARISVDSKGRVIAVSEVEIAAVTSVNVSGGSTGLTTTGGPITTAGSITLGGTLSINHGGTGKTTASEAINALLPNQLNNSGKVLTTDGMVVSWQSAKEGTVTSVGLVGSQDIAVIGSSPITESGSFALELTDTTVISGEYGSSSQVPVFTVDAKGRITNVLNTDINAVTSVGLTGSSDITVIGESPITSEGTFALELADTTVVPGSYTLANITVDAKGRITAVSNGSSGPVYTAGTGISIENNVISSLVKSAGDLVVTVQLGDGLGGFISIPNAPEGRVLTAHGGTAPPTWEPLPATGTVTSVNMDGGLTGLSYTGGPITVDGTITTTGVLNISHGGTGATTVNGIIQAILPPQTGNIGAALTTDGSGNLSWQVPSGSQYYAGVGLTLNSTIFNSIVANNTGESNRVQISNGDGTLSNLPAGTAGQVLTSKGAGQAPEWGLSSGTVTNIQIVRNQTSGLNISGGSNLNPPNPDVKEITTTGAISLSGTLTVLHGGTGATTELGARYNLIPGITSNAGKYLTTDGVDIGWNSPIPNVSGQTGKFLTTDGVNVSWGTPEGTAGTVTSVDVNGGDTGITVTGGPIVVSGTMTMGGVLNVAHGGTGKTTAAEAINSLLPNQTGNDGKILTTNGTSVSWTTASAGSVTSVDVAGGTTGLTTSGGPVTNSGTITLGGTLNIANGGTAAVTAQDALKNLLPSQAGNVGKVLTATETGYATWEVPPDTGGTVTSIDVAGGTTGLTTSGGPVTSNGTITLGGTLNIANGGTGKTTAEDAINALVPSQSGNAGKILSTNGTTVSWTTASAGSVTSVDIFGGATGLTFTGGPITSSGTFLVGGTLSLLSGGTGSNSAVGARTNLLPSQTGYSGWLLTTNGADVGWVDPATLGFSYTGGTGVTVSSGVISIGQDVSTSSSVTFNSATLSNNLSLGGSLTSTGSALNVTNTALTFNSSLTGAPTSNINLNVKRGTSPTVAIRWNESTKIWEFTNDGTTYYPFLTSGTGGTVTSIDVSGGTTGLTTSGGPVTTSGTITLAGTLSIANGGTGQTTATNAINALLPSQTGNSGKVLTSDGALATWQPLSANVAGSDTQVQYNNGGVLAASPNFTWNSSTNTVTATQFSGSGASLTNLNASNLTTGTVGTARLGTGTANSTTFLRGDGTWSAPTGTGTVTSVGLTGTSDIVVTGASPITSSGTFALSLSNTTVSPGSFGSSTSYPVITVDAKGRITSATEVTTTGSTTGGWLTYNGTNTYISIPNSTSLQFGGTFTISVWVNLSSLANRQPLFSTRQGGASGSWQLEVGSPNSTVGGIAISSPGVFNFTSASGIMSVNQWYNVCAVKANDATNFVVYLNGVAISGTTSSLTVLNNTDPKRIGSSGSANEYVNGKIATVAIYNIAQTATQVMDNFNILRGRFGV